MHISKRAISFFIEIIYAYVNAWNPPPPPQKKKKKKKTQTEMLVYMFKWMASSMITQWN